MMMIMEWRLHPSPGPRAATSAAAALPQKPAERHLFLCSSLTKSQAGLMRPRGPEHAKTRFCCSRRACIAAAGSTGQMPQPAPDLPALTSAFQPARRPLCPPADPPHSRQLSKERKGGLTPRRKEVVPRCNLQGKS